MREKRDTLGRGNRTHKGMLKCVRTLVRDARAVQWGWIDMMYQVRKGVRTEGVEEQTAGGLRQHGEELEPWSKGGKEPAKGSKQGSDLIRPDRQSVSEKSSRGINAV